MALIHTGSCLVELAKTELNSETSISLTEQALEKYKEASEIPPKPNESLSEFYQDWGMAFVSQATLFAKISQRNSTKGIETERQVGM